MISCAVMPTERDKMLAGQMYDPFDAELVAARVRARDLCQQLNATRESDEAERRHVLRELFGKGGDSVWMQPPFYCDYGVNIELGERVFFNFNCIVLDVCPVRIGDFTLFWTGVFPEAVRELQNPHSRDCFIDYCSHGKRSYLIAARIEADQEDDVPGDVLERLGRQFEMCAYGLREVRREWERRDDAEFQGPMLID